MDSDTDDILASLEKEDDLADYRAQRLEQLQSEFSSHHQQHASSTQKHPQLQHEQQQQQQQQQPSQAVTTVLNNASAAVPTLPNDQAVLDFTTQIAQCTVHFFHPDFSRCATMDKHFAVLARAHHESTGVRFARADVRDVPFVVEKLKIRVLPCVLGFRDGVVVERVVGFEGLGRAGADAERGFDTTVLEDRLLQCGVLDVKKVEEGGLGDGSGSSDDEDEDDDEDGHSRRRKVIRSGGGRSMGRTENDDDDDWD